jgi:alkanesulfonate monooxygenase
MRTSDSQWHRQLSATARAQPEVSEAEPDPFWLGPFQNYQTFCPYLVGSYDRVASAIGHYLGQGTRVFVLDIPPSAEELEHIGEVFARAGVAR